MSKPVVTNMTFVPAPIDGLNLIANPNDILPTEARQLDNYLVYDSGIRQAAAVTLNQTFSGSGTSGFLFRYFKDDLTEQLLVGVDNKIYRYDSPTATATAADLTNGTAITQDKWNPCLHNKLIFLFNGTDTPRTYDRSAGTVSNFSPTGPSASTLIQGCSGKHRLRVVQANSTTYWYGGVDAVSGTFTAVDLGQVFETSGNLAYCFSWAYNQGSAAEELIGFVNTAGELLLYSGDYEGSPNWTLAVRAKMPRTVTSNAGLMQPFVKTANDILFATTSRGLVPLSSIVSGRLQESPYFTVSRKIKDQILSTVQPVIDLDNPFLFCSSTSDIPNAAIYVLNYERAAWSKILMPAAARYATALAIFQGHLMILGTSTKKLYNVNLNSTGYADSTMTYTWKTPFFDFGKDYQKHSKFIRVLGTDRGSAASFKNTVSVSTEFVDPSSPTTDTKTTALSAANVNAVQELAPPGTGTRLSYCFSRAGVANEKNELQGFVAAWEYGGCY